MKRLAPLAAGFVLIATPLAADGDIAITDPYARSAGPSAQAGAAFMTIENHGAQDDRLTGATADIAERVELHTHDEDDDGVMRMFEVAEGFAIPAGGSRSLARGGEHVMLMGLAEPFEDGATITLTLEFEQAGAVRLDVPVDQERGQHGDHDH